MNLLQMHLDKYDYLNECYAGSEINRDDLKKYMYAKTLSTEQLSSIADASLECFTQIFPEKDAFWLMDRYLSILEEYFKDDWESMRDDDGKFSFNDIFDSFIEILNGEECEKKNACRAVIALFLDYRYKTNPFEKILSSQWVKILCEIFEIEVSDAALFFSLYLMANKDDFIKINNDNDMKVFYSAVTGENPDKFDSLTEKSEFYQKKGLWSDNMVCCDFLLDFFGGMTDWKITLDSEKSYVDSFSYESMVESNSESCDLAKRLLTKCRRKKDGFLMSVYNQENRRLKNFISAFCRENNYKVYNVSCSQDVDLNFVKHLVIISGIVARKNGAIVISESTASSLVHSEGRTSSLFKNGMIDFMDDTSDSDKKDNFGHGSNADSEFNTFEILNKIQCPIFVLADPFIKKMTDMNFGMEESEDSSQYIEKTTRKDPVFFEQFFIYNWALKIPSCNTYSDQLREFLASKNIMGKTAEETVHECSVLKLEPSKWKDVAEKVSSIDKLPGNYIRTAVKSIVACSDLKNEVRKNSHYSLKALNTSISADELIVTLKNARNWQVENYDAESGLRVLLYGISGGGKTAFVEYVSKELEKDLIFIRTSDFMRSRVGVSEVNIRTLFENARENDSIIFIDEAESILRDRKNLQYNWEVTLVNEIIQQMERFPGIMFCSTNLAEFMDNATNRRFHIQVKFNSMTKEGTKELFARYFENYEFTAEQIDKVFNSGEICPGDFYTVYSRLRFADKKSVDSAYIVKLLIEAVENKKKNGAKSVGFSI